MSDDPCLSDSQVENLTGYKLPAYQARWLTDNAIKFYVNARGKVRVPREAVSGIKVKAPLKKTEPDFTQVRRTG